MTDNETLVDETQDDDSVVVHLVGYENSSDMDVAYDDDGTPRVTNHDELEKYDEARRLNRDSVERVGFGTEIIEPGDSLWREEFRDLELGEAVRL